MRTSIYLFGMALAASGLTIARDAQAIQRFDLANGSADCQSALPVFDGNIRKRPTAISNEGTKSAFVSCSVHNNNNGAVSVVFGVTLTNNSAADVDVNCSMVNGFRFVGALLPVYSRKSSMSQGANDKQAMDVGRQRRSAVRVHQLQPELQFAGWRGDRSVYTIYEDGSVAAP